MSSLDYWLCPQKSAFLKNDFRSINFKGIWQKHFINAFVDEIFKNGETSAIMKHSNDKEEHLPKNLYKFCPPSKYSVMNLKNSRLWLSSPEKFNDPFDSFIGVDQDAFCKRMIARELLSRGLVTSASAKNTVAKAEYLRIRYAYTKHINSTNREKQRLSRIMYELRKCKTEALSLLLLGLEVNAKEACKERINQLRNSAFSVSCFSAFNDEKELGYNTTMWSHYAANHTGFCIKYKVDPNQYLDIDELKCGLYPVIYSGNMVKVSPEELFKVVLNENGHLSPNSNITKTIYRALIIKSRFWNYEKEWRLILNKKSRLFKEGSIHFPFVEEIYLGCKIETSLRNSLVSYGIKNGTPVFEAKMHDEHFILDFVPVTS